MSRERNIKRLKNSLSETQDILNDLVTGTGKDAGKRLDKANSRLQKNLDNVRSELEDIYGDTSKDVQKRYLSTRKDLEKQAERTKSQFRNRFADGTAAARAAKTTLGAGALALAAKADIPSRAASAASFLAKTGLAAKAAQLFANSNLKYRTASALEGAAGGFVAARNKLNPSNKVVLRSEKDRDRVTKAGYFIRFSALAIIIISKRHKLMELGTQLYDKVKDSEGRAELTQDVKDQLDTMRRLMKAYGNGQYREFPYRSLVKIVAAVVYFVSVADLIPDFIPVLGLTDDLAILAWVFSSVKDDLQQFVDWEAAEEKRRTRLAKQSDSATGSSSSSVSTGTASTTGSTSSSSSSNTIANVGNATPADRKASPASSTGSDSGSKISVTTGTSGESSSDRNTNSGNRSTGSGSTGSSDSNNKLG